MNSMTGIQIAKHQRSTSNWKDDLVAQIQNCIRPLAEGEQPKSARPATATKRRQRMHLAIFNEPYLTLILEHKKTLESRFSINRCAPYQEVSAGDIVVLKVSGGPVMGLATIGSATHLRISNPEELCEIAEKYSSALHVDGSDFWEQRKKASYCTLIEFENIERLVIDKVFKRDRLGWVVLQREQIRLFEEKF
jgi:hypothetical protein